MARLVPAIPFYSCCAYISEMLAIGERSDARSVNGYARA
jgi:hypothetical protein